LLSRNIAIEITRYLLISFFTVTLEVYSKSRTLIKKLPAIPMFFLEIFAFPHQNPLLQLDFEFTTSAKLIEEDKVMTTR
jgi:hypothetical protein